MAAEKEQALTLDVVKALIDANTAGLIEAVKELKKPSAEEQAKLDEEAAKRERDLKGKIELAFAEEERKQAQRRNCSHRNDRFHTIRAQVMTPRQQQPYFVPTCIKCQSQSQKVPASAYEVQNGVNLDQHPNLTFEDMDRWAAERNAALASGVRL